MISSAEARLAVAEQQIAEYKANEEELRAAVNAANAQHGYWYRRCEFAEVALENWVREVDHLQDQYGEKMGCDGLDAARVVLAERRKTDLQNYEDFIRNTRQKKVLGWAIRAFGGPNGEHTGEVITLQQRALRFLEEAVELYQAVCAKVSLGNPHQYEGLMTRGADCYRIMAAKEPGEIGQEIGGTMVTLLCLAEVADKSVSEEEKREFERVLSKPPTHWAARWQAKREIGL